MSWHCCFARPQLWWKVVEVVLCSLCVGLAEIALWPPLAGPLIMKPRLSLFLSAFFLSHCALGWRHLRELQLIFFFFLVLFFFFKLDLFVALFPCCCCCLCLLRRGVLHLLRGPCPRRLTGDPGLSFSTSCFGTCC